MFWTKVGIDSYYTFFIYIHWDFVLLSPFTCQSLKNVRSRTFNLTSHFTSPVDSVTLLADSFSAMQLDSSQLTWVVCKLTLLNELNVKGQKAQDNQEEGKTAFKAFFLNQNWEQEPNTQSSERKKGNFSFIN